MASLMLIPSQEGLELLKENIKDNLNYAVLLDINKQEIKRYEFFKIFYDEYGVLCGQFEIPFEDNLTTPMKYIRVVNNNDMIISEGETPEIAFVTGLGGIQTIKFSVTGEPGEIIFKANDYVTENELSFFERKKIITTISYDFNAETNNIYLCDTRNGSFNIYLPSSPSNGDTITIIDEKNNFDVNGVNVVINNPEHTIMNLQENMIVDIKNISFTLMFYNNNWIII